MSKQLKQNLVNNSHLTLKEQSEKLNTTLMTWQGTNEQVDDVLIMGIKL